MFCAQVLHILQKIIQKNPFNMPTHTPVLLNEILMHLLTPKTKVVFDGTLGLGGHAKGIFLSFPKIEKYIGCDLDMEHLSLAKKRLNKWFSKLLFQNCNFSEIKKIIKRLDFSGPLAILLDLGLCSLHVDLPEKGFSYAKNGPLKMSFGSKNKLICVKIINEASEKDLSRIFKEFGEEPLAHKISRKIVEARKHTKIETTGDLREIVENAVHPAQRKKTLPRIFQGLRIAVNDELVHLEKTLNDGFSVMQPGDRMGIISYHSLEDRMVKKFFSQKSKPKTEVTVHSLHTEVEPPQAMLLTRKAIIPSHEEIVHNPRARSAKLRIIEKIQ